jgi:hypothetical protein
MTPPAGSTLPSDTWWWRARAGCSTIRQTSGLDGTDLLRAPVT